MIRYSIVFDNLYGVDQTGITKIEGQLHYFQNTT